MTDNANNAQAFRLRIVLPADTMDLTQGAAREAAKRPDPAGRLLAKRQAAVYNTEKHGEGGGTMLKIAICDDDTGDRERIAEDLRVYAAAHQEHSIEMTVYSSAFAMLDAFEKAGCPDIALLDICMPGMLGTELARDILRCSENTDILFLTTSSDYAVDAFALHAADYIQKPYTQEKLSASLDRVIALRQERTWLLLPCEGELHRIALEDVLYIETDGKRRSFSLASGRKLTARLTAAQLQDCLAGRRGMIPCGASYVVNLAHVRCFSGTDLIMDGGERIPVPRRLRAQIKQAYFDFYLEEVRNG